ncbi:MAG: bifunctional anthranilate synthase component I family protein/class IV aminotransferase [Methylibium sp.]|uniref:bifunctional anthranilate synthase component I family protein/class IV aminotransferase n=1 Tax=Methylibium sp. TaxID=2067992 RepID=UPI0017AB1DA3|nr:bifunctional anthranilate synthase component I family protein/class IV aminotransferase [Methylibium sp.]MBA3598272.1 bifunctional anthranilate synthase component I family protein/class IV aminotransferase [Methylibium sp.]
MQTTPFALLDDRNATDEHPTSRLYTGYAHERRCTDPATLDAMWAEVESDQRAGLHALVLADYEWGNKLLGAGVRKGSDAAALRVLLFHELQHLSASAVALWLAEQEGSTEPGPAGALDVEASVDRTAFHEAIGRIHEAIRAGETYQVNYTYRLDFAAYGTPVALYRRLRARQPVPFGAFIALPSSDTPGAATHVLSCSPELFIRHLAGHLTAKPMKGTAPRRNVFEGDSETARHLSLDTKNRAENLMIVDLLRNDLGRIARVGSVRVPELFEIESHATVFQMTSTVQAELVPGTGFPDLLRASFPCGSITGAPKHHTMELIEQLETTPRGLYCGAIGWVDAPVTGARCGDACLSVAIRTLTLGDGQNDGVRPGRLGIGAGIVLDSEAEDEYAECRLKGRFLTALDPGFALIETMHASREHGVRHLERHLARLAASAQALGFACDLELVKARIQAQLPTLPPGGPARLRLELDASGSVALTNAPLIALPQGEVRVRIGTQPLSDARPLAGHKTTLRAEYDAGVAAAESEGAFDTLFFTTDGRLVEGGRSTVFVRLDGRWFTPPLADGALPGVMRAVVLDDPSWAAAERSVDLADMQRAERIVVCNALRGALEAVIA